MYKRICVKTGLLFFLLSILLLACREENPNQEKAAYSAQAARASGTDIKTISIRNETNDLIHFTVKPVDSTDYPEDRVVRTGEIDRILTTADVISTFRQDEEVIRSRLSAGKNYSFRYDEQGKIALQEGWSGIEKAEDLAPFLATPMEVVDLMLEMADVGDHDILYDLGCGDGRIVIRAAKKYGSHGVGIDFNPTRIKESREEAKKAGVENLVEFRLEDVTKSDFSSATVVTVYLLTRSNAKLRPLFNAQLKPGTRVVAHNYEIPGWEHKEVECQTVRLKDNETHTIFLYKK